MTTLSFALHATFTDIGFDMPYAMKVMSAMFCPAAIVTFALLCLASVPFTATAAPPRYDHVLIVVEENRTPGQIIGDTNNAPYITSLANGGVSMGSMYGIIHPSQPNYLELFSGANQGVDDDNLPPNFSTTPTSTYPFRTPNLGAELISAGVSFAGYSEQLETATNDWADFDPHTGSGIDYRRRHNPWANWVAKVSPIPANQVSSNVNKAFTQFPGNYANLPTVAFVIPDLQHDMHNGSRKEGDEWLRTNINSYAVWAKTNNSLLIITWDEDDYNQDNRIPTVLYGAHLRDGTVAPGTWTHHNMLRTLEDMYGTTTHAGSAAQARSIVGPFTTDPVVSVATFRQGLNGYAGARDTQIWQETPDTSYATLEDLTADLDTGSATGNQVGQVLIRFDNLFGSGADQVPPNATIHSAKLILNTPKEATGTPDYHSDDLFRAHRMINDWTDTATWNSLSGGVSADNVEAASTASFSVVPHVDGGPAIFDVTADVELFQAGTANRGWVIRPSSTGSGDGWTVKSSEYATNPALRPSLEIVYSVSVTPYASWAAAHGLTGTDALPNANPDHDRADNLAEFAYNLNPLAVDAVPVTPIGTNGLPAAHYLSNVSGGVLEVQFIRRKGPTAAGLTYAVTFSGDLTTWSSSNLTPSVTSLGPDWERVTLRDSVLGPNTARFAKVVLTLQQ